MLLKLAKERSHVAQKQCGVQSSGHLRNWLAWPQVERGLAMGKPKIIYKENQIMLNKSIMMTQSLIQALGNQRQVDLCKFKTSKSARLELHS